MRRIFTIHGLPQQLVSDNGPQFVSDQFAQFLKQNGIKHFRSSPYHPSTNGLSERFIQTLKKSLKANKDEGTLQQQLARFLLSYRTTPHATTKEKPCVLLMGRSLRTRLDLLRPNHETQVLDQQAHQKSNHDKNCKERQFTEGELVLAKNFSSGPKWFTGVIEAVLRPLSYLIKLEDGRIIKRHIDHLLNHSDCKEPSVDDELPLGPTLTQETSPVVNSETSSNSTGESNVSTPETVTPPQSVERRYPQRQHRKPDRYTS